MFRGERLAVVFEGRDVGARLHRVDGAGCSAKEFSGALRFGFSSVGVFAEEPDMIQFSGGWPSR